jgi:PAS domain-containing protein
MPARHQRLNSTDRRLVQILDSLPVAVIIVDPWEHTIVYANPECARIMNQAPQALLGNVCHKCICPEAAGRCPITDLGQEVDRSQRCVLNNCGQRVPIFKTVCKIEFDGRIHYLETFMDISDRKGKERLQGTVEMD